MKKDNEKIIKLIGELQKYDNATGYKLKYEEVKKKLSLTIKDLTLSDEEALDELHKLIEHPKTWSSLFALEILKDIKNERSIQYMIDYIIKNEKEDYDTSCEKAMFALTNMGEIAVESLIKEIKDKFEKNIFYIYLVGSLTEIKSCIFWFFF